MEDLILDTVDFIKRDKRFYIEHLEDNEAIWAINHFYGTNSEESEQILIRLRECK